jgi:hypothetical protein
MTRTKQVKYPIPMTKGFDLMGNFIALLERVPVGVIVVEEFARAAADGETP